MDYPLFDDPNVSRDAIMDYVFTPDFATLDDDTRSHIKDCLKGSSVSFCSAYLAEWVFARMTETKFPQSFISLAAAAGAYCLHYGVDNISGERGAGIVNALRRERGEPYPVVGGAWPKADADPDPRANFVKPEPEPTPPIPDPLLPAAKV